jgi:integrase
VKKRTKTEASRFKPRSKWKVGSSVLQGRREGVGRLLYYGQSARGGDRFRLILNDAGPGRTLTVSDVSVSKAYDKLRALHRDRKVSGKPTVGPRYTLADLAGEYFTVRMTAAIEKGYSPSPAWVSLEQQRIESYVLARFGSLSLLRLDAAAGEQIVECIKDLKGVKGKALAPTTKIGTWHSFITMLGWAVRTGMLVSAPFGRDVAMKRLAKAPGDVYERKAARTARGWNDAELEAFWRKRDLSLQIDRMVSLAVLNGPRPGELCLIRIEDIDLERGTLCIDKSANDVRLRTCKALQDNPALIREWQDRHNGAAHVPGAPKTLQSLRTIHLDSESMAVVRRQLEHVEDLCRTGIIDSDQAQYLFPNAHPLRRTPFLSPSRLRKQWLARCTGFDDNGRPAGRPMAGVRYLPPYGWRHTCARNFLRVLTIEEVASLLGSSVREIQNSYNDWIPAISREVANKKEKVIARLAAIGKEQRS